MDRSCSMITVYITFIITFFVSSSESSFYLRAAAPVDFQPGDPLEVKVNKLSSTKTQLPYDYYHLNYCRPKQIHNTAKHLGEILLGDRSENSVYKFNMREDLRCKVSCRIKLDAKSAKSFKEMSDDEYRVNMILDNLPVAVARTRFGSQSTAYEHGFRVGFKGYYSMSTEPKYFINNHLSFRVMYRKNLETNSSRIVGFEVTPNSINHEYKEWDEKNTQLTTCNQHTKSNLQLNAGPQMVDIDNEVVFTYDVTFKESNIKWASRWDAYLLTDDDPLHWFSITTSLIIVLFLSGMLALIMMRILYKDISTYNQFDPQDDSEDETGWKVIHGDVFRPPTNSWLLSVHVGVGVQIFGTTLTTMIFSLLGFLSPSNHGNVMTAVLSWVFMGFFAGFSSAHLYKTLKGTEWKKNALKTSVMFPGILFAAFVILNALIWKESSSGAVPFGTMVTLVCLLIGISVPLVFVGSYFGFKKPVIEDPVKTNEIPRQVPEQRAWYTKPLFSVLIGGVLPFGVVFIELFFVLTSVWLNQFYNIVGFLFITFVILVITCTEVTIILCYLQLRSEDYHWWWRAYLTAGSSALYVFLFSIFYFVTRMEITRFVSGLLYFVCMLIASYAFFMLTGTVGFYACLWFVRKIYSSLKID